MAEGDAPPVPGYADSKYTEEVGRLEHQLKTTLAGDEETLRNAKTAYDYNNSLIRQREAPAYARNRYRAVNEGVAQSGINTERRGGLAAGFTNQFTAQTNRLQQTQARTQRGEQTAREGTQIAIGEQGKAAEERARARTLKEEPNEAGAPIGVAPANPATPVNAGGQVTLGPGGQRTEKVPGGFVRTGGSPRRAAVQKAIRAPNVVNRKVRL